jgi:hypothetical protein
MTATMATVFGFIALLILVGATMNRRKDPV